MRGVCVALLLASAIAGCSGAPAETPSPSSTNTLPPDIRGQVVMVLPVQAEVGVGGDADAELAFALGAVESGIEWVFRSRLESALERSPGLDARTTGLPVGMFLRREVNRVGDPLYGYLRRLAALVNADIALIPVLVAPSQSEDPDSIVVEGQVTLETNVAMIDVRTGRVLWFGVVAGEPGELGSPGVLASTMDGLARRLLWYVRR
jgi:hypothetical protein